MTWTSSAGTRKPIRSSLIPLVLLKRSSISASHFSPCRRAARLFHLRAEQANDIFKFKGAHLQFPKAINHACTIKPRLTLLAFGASRHCCLSERPSWRLRQHRSHVLREAFRSRAYTRLYGNRSR
jgi:hypothetical protein